MKRKCPNCRKVELVARKVKGRDVEVLVCPKCKGAWFSKGQLESLLPGAAQDVAIPEDAQLAARSCPECSLSMFQFNYPGTLVPIDMCRVCHGLWIDEGEAREISLVRKGRKAHAAGKGGESASVKGPLGRLATFAWDALDWLTEAVR